MRKYNPNHNKWNFSGPSKVVEQAAEKFQGELNYAESFGNVFFYVFPTAKLAHGFNFVLKHLHFNCSVDQKEAVVII